MLGDVIGNAIGIAYVFGGVYLSGKLEERTSPNFARTVLHFAMGFWTFTWFLYETRIGAIITPIIATISLALVSRNIRGKFSEERERHVGLVFYSVSVMWVTLLFWDSTVGTRLWIGAAALFTLAFGDGLGGVIGMKYGNHVYKLPWVKKKTIEGSFGVGLGTTCAIILAQVMFGAVFLPLTTILGAVLTILIEAVSPAHSDNLFVPAGIAVLFVLLSNVNLLM